MTPKGDQALRDIRRQFEGWLKQIENLETIEAIRPADHKKLTYSYLQQLAKEIQNRHFNFVDDNLVILDSELMRMKREVEQ